MPAKDGDEAERFYFNGINGATGEYGLPPMSAEELAKLIVGEAPPENLSELSYRYRQQNEAHLGVKEGVDPKELGEAGWGVVFAQDADPAVRSALQPLLDLRAEQAGERFKVYESEGGYRPGESKGGFLARHGVGPGPSDPERVPYYLLLVGSPEAIPYRFQSQLDVQYAVGRIHFDAPEDYANYARSVVATERRELSLERRVLFFGVANPEDRATGLSRRTLVAPLFDHFKKKPDWKVEAFLDGEATKANLIRVLGGGATPALVFSASHGMEFPPGDPRQTPHQGALLCQDWPGPKAWGGTGSIPQDLYFAGDDLTDDARLLGLLSFVFACYGGGTPALDDFAKQAFRSRKAIAPHPFLAALPRRMLSHPKGGALAVIGHVDRAWGYSFLWSKAGPQTTVFESTLERLLDGHPVGSALEFFNERYAELSTLLSDEIEEIEFGKKYDPHELASLWTANNDARGYIIIGDPAVRLPVAGPHDSPEQRPAIELRTSEPEILESAAEPEEVSFAAAPEGEAEGVYFRAYHPRAMAPGVWRKLLVYGHLSEVLGKVEQDAGQILGREVRAYKDVGAPSSMALPPGTEITVVPTAEQLQFDPPERVLRWTETWHRTDFQMRALAASVGHVAHGSIEFYVGPLLVAELRLDIVVIPEEEARKEPDPGSDVHSARMYRSVFASYSHADTGVVEAVERAYQALGMDYLRDVMTLKSGQSWSDELLRKIEEADIFQLFWSTNASRSAYVEQEWRHAVRQSDAKGSSFIRPVYWEEKLAWVPPELSHVHFARVDFSRFLESTDERPPAIHLESDLMTLTVSTYLGEGKDSALLARTRISISGDVETHVVGDNHAGNESLLALHQETVREALRSRLAYLEIVSRKRF
jgi:hypothetical protein